MKRENRNKGFTLVEMIVVIVILGILLAILVPGLFKYIKKAKDQQAIIECRAVVTAAQALALELYGKDKFNSFEFTTNIFWSNICNEADVSGSIKSGVLFSDSPKTQVSYLEYKTQGGIIVAYDINTSVVYYIKDDFNLTEMDNRLHNYGEMFDKNYNNNYGQWNTSRDEYFKSDEAQLSSNEIDLLSERTTLTKENLEALRWLPCRYQKEDSSYEHYFVATTESGKFYVSIVYYNGSYYYYQGDKGKTGSDNMLDDKSAANTIDKLNNAKTNADDLTDVKKEWIKIVK